MLRNQTLENPIIMKTTASILASSLFAPFLLLINAGVVTAASLVIVVGLLAIAVSDYGQSTEPSYTKITVGACSTKERLPLAA